MSFRPLPFPRRRSGRRILGVPALLTALLLAMLAVLVGTAPARADDRVRVELTSITPAVTAATDTVTISGIVTNTGDTPLTGVQAYLWRDQQVRTTRAELATTDGPVGARWVTRYAILGTDPSGTLAPGQQSTFIVSAPWSALGIPARDGVTMIGVQIRGSYGEGNTTLGRARAWLPQDLGPQTTPVRLASVVLLASTPSRVAAGTFLDDHLAHEIAPGGRLDLLLRSAAGSGRSYLVDPALILSLQEMAAGYELTDGSAGAGEGDAKAWLATFDTLPTSGYRLPYGVADIDLLAGIDHADIVQSALDPAELPADVAELPTAVLPADGLLTRRGLATLATPTAGAGPSAGSSPTASPSATPGKPPIVLTARPAEGSGTTRSAAPSYWTTAERAPVVTYDPQAFAAGPDAGGSDAQQRQSLAAVDQLDALAGRPVQVRLITDVATAHADDLDTSATRVSLSSLTEGSSAPISDALLQAPPSDEDDQTRDVRRAATSTTGLASMFTDPGVAADRTWRATAILASTQWTGAAATPLSPAPDPTAASEAYVAYRNLQRDRVWQITGGDAVAISARPVLLTARQDTQFPVTVTNNLPVPVSVRLEFESENAERLHVPSVDIRTIGAGEAIAVGAVPRVEANGNYTVVARLTTPAGTVIGVPEEIDVQATQAGRVGWILMIVSGIVVIGTTVLRIKQVRTERSHA
ncbi:DUF6049 family protein [Raineyella sp. LH-20]|uniref:DUF6049 family protein n=1 Tax=Raineyella sp. LH-20 TaxID=3081204 RepID=UPI0029530516|nr:DUF6049 family protein [Raineyella sp. LH-20]WOP19609.1 DUF6049 family protein [Raineyella sp. LH-20]